MGAQVKKSHAVGVSHTGFCGNRKERHRKDYYTTIIKILLAPGAATTSVMHSVLLSSPHQVMGAPEQIHHRVKKKVVKVTGQPPYRD